jgi:hypothetical protein
MSESSDTRDARLVPLERKQCQRCGAFCRNDETACWFCQRDFAQPWAPPLRRGQFSLFGLMGVMTAVAIGMGIFAFSPALAVVIVLFSVAALVRLAVVESLAVASSTRRFPAHFAWRFFASLMLVFLAAIAGAITFVVGCFASALLATNSRPIPDFPIWPIGLSFVLGLVIAGWVLWVTRHVTMTD